MVPLREGGPGRRPGEGDRGLQRPLRGRALSRARTLAALAAAAALLRAAAIAFAPNRQVSDFAVYHELAAALASGQGYALTGPVGEGDIAALGGGKDLPYTTAHRAPGAAFVGALLYRLMGPDPLWFKFSNLALGAATTALLALLGSPWGAAAWAAYPSAVFATNLFGSEVLFAFLLALLALLLARERGPRGAAAAGLTAAACGLVRAGWLPVAAAALWTLCRERRRRRARAAAFLAALAAGLAPWTLRNYLHFGRLVPVTTNEGDFVGRRTALHLPEAAKDEAWRARWEAFQAEREEAPRAARGYALGLYQLRRVAALGPAEWLRFLGRNLAMCFSADDGTILFADLNSFGAARGPGPVHVLSARAYAFWLRVNHLFYLLLAAAAACALPRRPWRASPGLFFLCAYALLALAMLALVPGDPRHHFPLTLALAALAGRRQPPRSSSRGARNVILPPMGRPLAALFLLVSGAQAAAFEPAPPPPPGKALVYVYRLKVEPALRDVAFFIDGEEAFELSNKSYSWFYAEPGSHSVKTKWGFMSDVPNLEFVAEVEAGRTYFLKLAGSVRSMGRAGWKAYTAIERPAEADALADLQKAKKFIPAAAAPAREAGKTFQAAPPPPPGRALVYLYRPDCPPALRAPHITVDGRKALKLPNKSYGWITLEQGRHVIGTSWGFYRGVRPVEIALDATAGETYYLRLRGTRVQKGNYDEFTSGLDPITAGLAEKELLQIEKYSAAEAAD